MAYLTLVLWLIAFRVENGIDRARLSGLQTVIGFETEVDFVVWIDIVIHTRTENPLFVHVGHVGDERIRARDILAEDLTATKRPTVELTAPQRAIAVL